MVWFEELATPFFVDGIVARELVIIEVTPAQILDNACNDGTMWRRAGGRAGQDGIMLG